MAIYFLFGKKDEIKGNVTSKGFENWVEADTFQVGAARSVPMMVGKASQREASNPSLSEATFSKILDPSSPYLFQESLVGEGKPLEVHVTKTGADNIETLVKYTFEAAMISGYSISSSGDVPVESVSFAYTKVEMQLVEWDKDHKKSSPHTVGYDLGTGKKI